MSFVNLFLAKYGISLVILFPCFPLLTTPEDCACRHPDTRSFQSSCGCWNLPSVCPWDLHPLKDSVLVTTFPSAVCTSGWRIIHIWRIASIFLIVALCCTIGSGCFEMTTSQHSSIYLTHRMLGSTLRCEAGGVADNRSMGWVYVLWRIVRQEWAVILPRRHFGAAC